MAFATKQRYSRLPQPKRTHITHADPLTIITIPHIPSRIIGAPSPAFRIFTIYSTERRPRCEENARRHLGRWQWQPGYFAGTQFNCDRHVDAVTRWSPPVLRWCVRWPPRWGFERRTSHKYTRNSWLLDLDCVFGCVCHIVHPYHEGWRELVVVTSLRGELSEKI